MIRVANFDVVIRLDIISRNGAFAIFAQREFRFVLAVHNQGDAFEIEENLDHVFLHPFNRRILVEYAVDLYFGDRATRHGREQNTAQGITQGVTEASLQGLQGDLGAGPAPRHFDFAGRQ